MLSFQRSAVRQKHQNGTEARMIGNRDTAELRLPLALGVEQESRHDHNKETTMNKALSVTKSIYLDPEVEAELQNRLSRIEGHIRGIKRMLAAHASCEDLLIQLSAVRSALNQVTGRLLE